MFSPTHLLISRTKETPVQLVAAPGGYHLYTEAEWRQGNQPSFELKPKQGLFCRGMQVVGFRLEPLEEGVEVVSSHNAKAAQVS